jgi:hypothetical protein
MLSLTICEYGTALNVFGSLGYSMWDRGVLGVVKQQAAAITLRAVLSIGRLTLGSTSFLTQEIGR